jgi:hypothetical protein
MLLTGLHRHSVFLALMVVSQQVQKTVTTQSYDFIGEGNIITVGVSGSGIGRDIDLAEDMIITVFIIKIK